MTILTCDSSKYFLRWTWILATLLPMIVAGASAGPDQESTAQSERVFFSVLDENERPVLGLSADDFELRINGRRSALSHFRPGESSTAKSCPVVLWILVDNNPLVPSAVISNQAGAVVDIFERVHPDSAIGVKVFDDRLRTLAPLIREAAAVRNAFLQFREYRSERRVDDKRLKVGLSESGLMASLELAIEELQQYVASQSSLRERVVLRSILILSPADAGPRIRYNYFSYANRAVCKQAVDANVFLYPVCFEVPSGRILQKTPYGKKDAQKLGDYTVAYNDPRLLYDRYFELARKTGGVPSFFGAIAPGLHALLPPENISDVNLLTMNIIHMIRDLNGKYSFEVQKPGNGKKLQLDLKARMKNVKVILLRRTLL